MRYRITWQSPRLRKELRRVALAAAWLFGGGALVALVFGFSFYFAMRVEMRSTEVKVPDLAGLTLEEAARRVEPLDLVLQVVDQRNDPAVASGRVLQQTPAARSSVRRGRKVKLVISLGGRVLVVPQLVGHASRAVEIELRQEGFMPGEEARIRSHGAAPGTVLAQVPPAETPAVPNTRVHRLVSDGEPVVTWVMPDLTGLGRGTVERWIESSPFRRGTVRRVRMNGRRVGTVVGQLPLAGYPIHARDVIELTVAE